MVILNGNIRSSLVGTDNEKPCSPALTEDGFVNRESDGISRFACGFSMEPADVAESVIQASSAAVRVLLVKRNS
jgi:heterodisulfide reductase subunit A-like polyferredoxin